MKKCVGLQLVLILSAVLLLMPIKALGEEELLSVMGRGSLAPEQMFYMMKKNNESAGLNPQSDEDIKLFVLSLIKEAESEKVNYDVVYSLIMHETGWLNFGGDVSPSQFNYGGIGATGGGNTGASFDSPKIGIRAVVQHLKAYACSDELKEECVDPRFSKVLRGCAPYVQWLGKADNPKGAGWAVPGKGYGDRLIAIIEKTAKTDTQGVDLSQIGSLQNEAQEKTSFSLWIWLLPALAMAGVMLSGKKR